MNRPGDNAEAITRASHSNLALAFVVLPRARRRDISVFYAFCRVVDDIADSTEQTVENRRAALELWRKQLEAPTPGEPPLAPAVRDLMAKYQLPREYFHEIITGVEMDVIGTTYDTWENLRIYCHRVASVVGLISIKIFGCHDPGCHQYALDLGLALQVTNILRDVGQDFASHGRIYLPREDMNRFGYTFQALALQQHDARFVALMEFEAGRASEFFRACDRELPASERRNLAPAQIMRAVYGHLLLRMQQDGFQVFTKKYRVGSLQKAICIARVLADRWRSAA